MKQRCKPELLAPAGNIESFFAALENGADAVYVGYRHLNARAQAANFSLKEIARLNEYAHHRGRRLYVALNALVREEDLEHLVEVLAALSHIEPDGLIIQDAAVLRLCLRHFPKLKLHASTLMAVHNASGVEQLETMGFKRAVLARELTVDEVAQAAAATRLELEIFVHGALCFSYSGQCLASSFYGGRSSLRGRCVQPCRRLYRSGREQGYFFSTNDLSAVDLIPTLTDLHIAAFKIEGRMKPASYVAAVVRAYRTVMDAPADQIAEAVAEARRGLREALGRKPTKGFFAADRHREILSPHRSGASGRLAATVAWVGADRMALRLRLPLAEGDRLRLDSDEGFEKGAFTLKGMALKGRNLSQARSGATVSVPRVATARRGDRLFKTDSRTRKRTPMSKLRRTLSEKTSPVSLPHCSPSLVKEILHKPKATGGGNQPITVYLRLSNARSLNHAFASGARWVVLQASRANLHQQARMKMSRAKRDRLFWALPPIIHEKDVPFYRAQVSRLQQMGYGRWLVANWGHFRLFSQEPALLAADSTFNALNSQACAALHDLGCQFVVLSLENDRANLKRLLPGIGHITPLATIYARPALFTSRLEVRPRQGAPIRGPGRERFHQLREDGLTVVRADVPFCLFEHLQELRKLGIRDFISDLRGEQVQLEQLQCSDEEHA